MDIRLDFSRNVLGEVRERVLDNFAVYPDPEGDTVDTETWGHVHHRRWLSLDDIKLLYGGIAAESVQELSSGGMPVANMEAGAVPGDELSPPRFFAGWDPFETFLDPSLYGSANLPVDDFINKHRKLVSVVETQHRKLRKVRRFIDLRSGQIRIIPDHWSAERIQAVMQWAEAHQEKLFVDENAWVKSIRFTVSAADLILYDEWSPYRSFTIVPFFPDFRRGHTSGMVEDLIDPQREINKRRSTLLQVLMTTPNSGWKVRRGFAHREVEDRSRDPRWGTRAVAGAQEGAQAAQRIEAAALPQGFIQADSMFAQDLHEIAGINPDALGQNGQVVSGRAVEARQRSAYVGAEGYFESFERYQEQKARRRLEIVQDFYTEPRLFRVPNDAGDDQTILTNWSQASDDILNDINSGTYHVTVETAPISATFLQGAFEEAIELQKAGVMIPPKFLLEMSSIPFKKRIIDAMESAPPPPPPPAAIAAQAQAKRADNEIPLQELKNQGAAAVADAKNQTTEDIADKRVQLELSLEQMVQAGQADKNAIERERLRLEQEGTVLHQIGGKSPGANIPAELQRNSDSAFAAGNINASNIALQALDRMIGPIPEGTQTRASFQVLPHPAQEQ
jgi:hypothetical protein